MGTKENTNQDMINEKKKQQQESSLNKTSGSFLHFVQITKRGEIDVNVSNIYNITNCERSFSVLKRVKNRLRSNLIVAGDSRWSDMCECEDHR